MNDDAPLQQAFDVQDEYFALSGLPVYVVTPSSSDFEYHTIAGQQKLLSMSAAIDGNRWMEADSVSDWYPMFREWVHAAHGPWPRRGRRDTKGSKIAILRVIADW